ncbi:imidazole glycerol phosphate synthase subunit HisH [Tolypothrix campylonemoides VB511288]|nr:imidazole glycerol phosphate synthase subunit HisH [Tolypothrix campylonemoides VB511288]
MTDVVLVDSGVANIGSVVYALQRLGVEPVLTTDAARIRAADRVILPGVGAAPPAMARLREAGLVDVLRALDRPLLGICLGMQLLYDASEEGDEACLGLLPGRVQLMRAQPGVRIPHMGWNALERVADSPLLDGIDDGAQAYFVHSFAVPVDAHAIARSVHGDAFAAVVGRGRVFGAQFHPERSAAVGARLLRNFIEGRFP